MTLLERFERKLGKAPLTLPELVVAVSNIPYGRASSRSPETVIEEWRGTCSTKHLLLQTLVAERWPRIKMCLRHRVYVVSQALAEERWGSVVAATVPKEGVVDVHTYGMIPQPGRDITVDVTFPLADWDGRSDIPLACGDGEDVDAGEDPMATKQQLVETRCQPAVREPFIAALGGDARGSSHRGDEASRH